MNTIESLLTKRFKKCSMEDPKTRKYSLTELSQILRKKTLEAGNWKINSLLRFKMSQRTEGAENSAVALLRNTVHLFNFLAHL